MDLDWAVAPVEVVAQGMFYDVGDDGLVMGGAGYVDELFGEGYGRVVECETRELSVVVCASCGVHTTTLATDCSAESAMAPSKLE